jgi:hypothetical protein
MTAPALSTPLNTAVGVSGWLCQQLVDLLHQLVQQVEVHLRAPRRRTLSCSELAVLAATLQQVNHWLPAGHAVKQQVLKLGKLLPALLQAQEAPVQTKLLGHLYQVEQQLQADARISVGRHWLAMKPAPTTVSLQAVEWLCWQQQAAWLPPASATTGEPEVQLLNTWRVGIRSPAALGELLHKLQVLMRFGRSSSQQDCLADLAQRLSLACVQATLVSQQELLTCIEALWKLIEQHQCQALPEHACDDVELLQVLQADLSRYRSRIQHFLQQAKATQSPLLLPYSVLVLHYKLPWLLAAGGQAPLARLYHCWHQCLLLHWQYRLSLSPTLLDLLARTTQALELQQWQQLSLQKLAQWQLQLLRLWPTSPSHGVQRVALQRHSAAAEASVSLAAIPQLLASSFTALASCQAHWFVDAASLAPQLAALETELLLLEKGAAVVKVYAVESFCSLLLAQQHKIRADGATAEFPGPLLWRSYQHLLNLLDEAAAWQDPQLDMGLVDELQTWLQANSVTSGALMLREPEAGVPLSSAALAHRLHEFVKALALTVEQHLRFDVVVAAALSLTAMEPCENALKTFLRALILEQVNAKEKRRRALKPAATSIKVILASLHNGIQVEINEEGVEAVSGQQTLKRLRHKLPAQVQGLVCKHSLGQGRRFGFSIVVD